MFKTQLSITTSGLRKLINSRAQYGVSWSFCGIYRKRDGRMREFFSHGSPEMKIFGGRQQEVLDFVSTGLYTEQVLTIHEDGQPSTLVLAKSGIGDIIVIEIITEEGQPGETYIRMILDQLRMYSEENPLSSTAS